jgi:hypothetical protein
MYPQKYSSTLTFLRLVASGVLLLTLCGLISSTKTASSQAPSPETTKQEIEMVPPGQEKRFYNMVPPHLPLKIKVKNVNSKKWAHDIEVEVTNTSKRPIYFLDFYITLPEVRGSTGHKIGFWLKYGRAELVDFTIPIQPEDVPLNPGEKYTFKIPQSSAKGWDYIKDKEGKPEPKQILLEFQGLNFGDGTGFSDAGATPVNIHRKINFNKTCIPPPDSNPFSAQIAFSFLPASFLPVKLFWAKPFELYTGTKVEKTGFLLQPKQLQFC